MKRFALIGRSLGHSFSKSFFESYFFEHQVDASYENIELANIEEFSSIDLNDYEGFNVTIPYKEAIISYLDDLDETAKAINAVNVIARKNGKWKGYNTDAYGFHQAIKPFMTNQHERALVFGTGGASKAVAHVLTSLGVDVLFISRTPIGENQFAYNEINEHMLNACKLIVNCTPVGTYPDVDDTLSLPYAHLTPDHLVVDLIYNPEKTILLQRAEKQGAMILNGATMLRHQALKAWEIWNDV